MEHTKDIGNVSQGPDESNDEDSSESNSNSECSSSSEDESDVETEQTDKNEEPNTPNQTKHPPKIYTEKTVRSMKPACNCKFECQQKLSEKDRLEIHKQFWKLPSRRDRKNIVISTVKLNPLSNNLIFFLPLNGQGINVCQLMYLNTLSVSNKFVQNALNKNKPNNGRSDSESDSSSSEQSLGGQIDKTVNCCDCELNCEAKVDGSARKNIREEFWKLQSWVDRKLFVLSTIHQKIKGSIDYFLPLNGENVPVCQKLYLGTLMIGENFIQNTLNDILSDGRILEGGWSHQKQIRTRKLKPPCLGCRLKCSQRISQEARKIIHDEFWTNNDNDGKRRFILNTVTQAPIQKRVTEGFSRRTCTRKYTLAVNGKGYVVCKVMYYNTLGVSSKYISDTFEGAGQKVPVIPSEAPQTAKKIPEETVPEQTDGEVPKKRRKRSKDKKLKAPCENCRLNCAIKIPQEHRLKLVQDFWSMNWQGQRDFVFETVTNMPIQKRTTFGSSRRSCTRKYTLPYNGEYIIVCQTMYVNTLRLNSKYISTILENVHLSESI